jgi:hypothetical protein
MLALLMWVRLVLLLVMTMLLVRVLVMRGLVLTWGPIPSVPNGRAMLPLRHRMLSLPDLVVSLIVHRRIRLCILLLAHLLAIVRLTRRCIATIGITVTLRLLCMLLLLPGLGHLRLFLRHIRITFVPRTLCLGSLPLHPVVSRSVHWCRNMIAIGPVGVYVG